MSSSLAGALEGAVGGAAFPVLVDSVVRSARALRGVRDGWRVRTGTVGDADGSFYGGARAGIRGRVRQHARPSHRWRDARDAG
ncbi:MAG: hypothetical protein RID42_00210 [Alphaproteobacteria bacterium]